MRPVDTFCVMELSKTRASTIMVCILINYNTLIFKKLYKLIKYYYSLSTIPYMEVYF